MTPPLSPIDQVFTGAGSYPLEFVFAYAGRIDPDRLADSLRRTLDQFPAVASRLVPLPDRGWGLEPSEARVRLRGRGLAGGLRGPGGALRLHQPGRDRARGSPSRGCACADAGRVGPRGQPVPRVSSTASASSTSSRAGRARSRASRWRPRPTAASSSSRHPPPRALPDARGRAGRLRPLLGRGAPRHPPGPAALAPAAPPPPELSALLARAQAGCEVRPLAQRRDRGVAVADARAGLGRGRSRRHRLGQLPRRRAPGPARVPADLLRLCRRPRHAPPSSASACARRRSPTSRSGA